ncbi:hypothetical protein OQA88_749 [Cercophora sp. LCS_1]
MSTAYLTLPSSQLHRLAPPAVVGEALLSDRSPEGYFGTYFTENRPRVSPEVCVDILRFFARYGQQCVIPTLDLDSVDDRVRPSVKLVLDSLTYRAGLYGSRYYTVPEAFLYYTDCTPVCRVPRVVAETISGTRKTAAIGSFGEVARQG